MKLTPYAKQLRHFQKYGTLLGVAREPLSKEEADWVAWDVQYMFERTRKDDNDYRDYDPLPQRVLKWSQGTMVGARYSVGKSERSLDRFDVFYRERNVFQAHQSTDSLQVFQSFSHPDYPSTVRCWNVNYRNPERSFSQETCLDADPWES